MATSFQNCGETRELEQSSIVGANGPIAAIGRRENPTPRNRSLKWNVLAQVSSSSSDCGSSLREPSQNSLHVASKRDVNITKLNMLRSYQSVLFPA
ncbi:hypothetical protein AVEN_193118-1 [Araneus ventricosus]|uniref:Uncharacterized protein n=1 Tax=Araneus ventricosus TaxID=182803 RepID=A0A4Y2B0X4_ARAVE|nr:hypothetical protein AVEN_193118-1 [Araneus ventricosus]